MAVNTPKMQGAALARPRVAVFGAGMIGIQLGGMLADVADVVMIGRAGMLDPLVDGLRLTDLDGLDRRVDGTALERTIDPAALAGADLVLVTVKSMATPDAAAAIARHASPDALILSFQNGVSNGDVLRDALAGHEVVAGMVPYNVVARGPAHYHRATGGGLVAAPSERLGRFAPLFAAAGLPLRQEANIVGVQWGKLLVNLNNAVNALSGLPLAQQLMQRDYRRAWAAAMAEGLRVVGAAGIVPVDPLPMPLGLMPQILRLPDGLYRHVVAGAGGARTRVDPHARGSMADGLARGRRTEVDFLQGAVVRLAADMGRGAPVNARIQDLVRQAEAGAPPLAAAALLAALRS